MLHFERKEKLLIKVENDRALHYVDDLLWRLPKEGFLPHSTSEKEIDDFIVITKSSKNLNKANHQLNLCAEIIDLDKSYKIIYEFDDSLSDKKKALSKKRYHLYKEANFLIESK